MLRIVSIFDVAYCLVDSYLGIYLFLMTCFSLMRYVQSIEESINGTEVKIYQTVFLFKFV